MEIIETIGLILGVLGLAGVSGIWRGSAWIHKQIYSRFGSVKRVRKELRAIVGRRTYPYTQEEAGTYESVPVEFFVDLLAASGDPKDRDILDRWLTRWIAKAGLKPTHIAVPKRGNVVLAAMIARRLNLPLIVVYQENSLHCRPYEGVLNAGDRVLLVDDVTSDAQFITTVIDVLLPQDVYMVGVVSVVDRIEGRCAGALSERSISFHPVLTLGDSTLRDLTNAPS